jgi:Ni,Fe-hydrogenase I large subunit
MDIFIPLINGSSQENPNPGPNPPPAPTSDRIVIDPITRIEGHLRIEVKIENGQVTDAYSSTTMFRGLETILQGRDPREAWLFAQRICGVCTTVHAIASVRAVENALGITPPDNARLVRNLIEAFQYIHDHVIHFYHLHAPDWIDVVNALQADPAQTSALARSISDWPNSSPEYFAAIKTRLQNFVNSGQLGIFTNGYWNHPAHKLPPEGDLLAVAHYLEALDWQRDMIKSHALLGGKNPHPQSYLVGGTSLAMHASNSRAFNLTRADQLRALAVQALDFVSKVYIPDLLLIASFYKDWAAIGEGVGNYLAYGDFPTTTSGNPADLWLPQGIVWNKQVGSPMSSFDQAQIREYIDHSWYAGASAHPSQGTTTPNFTGPNPPFTHLDVANKYSYLKAPRYQDTPMEVGPLARMLVAYANGHGRTRDLVGSVLNQLQLGPEALFSTLGRVAARGIETLMIAEQLVNWVDELKNNIASGNLTTHNPYRWEPASWPANASGWGYTEAPRGALGHWITIQNGKIQRYQMVVPSTWNGSPRDAQGKRGPWETALIGTPIADPSRPVEVLRTVHSFDPCMACAVHLVDASGRPLGHVNVIS